MAPLTTGQRLACYLRLALFTVRMTPKLTRDLVIAVEEAVLAGWPGRPAKTAPEQIIPRRENRSMTAAQVSNARA